MNKVLVITDSNSGLKQSEAEDLGIVIIPMPFTIDGEEFLEDINITQDEFYQKLLNNENVKTSQPNQDYLENLWSEKLKEYDEIVHIPMSSGLSSTCENALKYSTKFNGKVQVVDNLRISLSQKESVFEAIALAKQGKTAKEIKTYLESTKDKASIYIIVDDLKFLQKGGRVSKAAAALGSLLNVKPILYSRGDKFDKFSLALSLSQAKKKMIQQIKKELENEFLEEYKNGTMVVSVAHTQNEAEALKFKDEILKAIPNIKFRFIDPLSLCVACHIGPGSLAICISKNAFLND